ncbi:phosphonate C-P lyase system protein PhnG [Roseobacter sp. HKCCD7870]|uniref:phosphonate C-P lyase system protein PhnG n=1 Tax=Roseobacter sp. HKCCD7870 TaxID=3120343 RepID=UPI0030EB595F
MSNLGEHIERQAWLSTMAQASADRLIALCQSAGVEVPHSVLRAPEIGTVMVRGRAGAVGAAFNLGEMTVTRASVRLTESGAVGHGYVQGRSHEAATYAALVDALCQTDQGPALIASVITPLRAEKAAREGARAVRAAGTKVEFFTMVRGE